MAANGDGGVRGWGAAAAAAAAAVTGVDVRYGR